MSRYDALKLDNQVCFPLYACSKELVRQYAPYLKELGITSDRFSVSTTIGDDQDAELDRCVIIEKQ